MSSQDTRHDGHTDECECMKTLGLQPRDEQPFKCPEHRHPEHKVINAYVADLRTVHSEFMKNLLSHTTRTFSCRKHGVCRHQTLWNVLIPKCIHGLGSSPA